MKTINTLWGQWEVLPVSPLQKLKTAQTCTSDDCGQEAFWTYNGYAICDDCIQECADMNDDNAQELGPALAEIAALAGKTLCPFCHIKPVENDFFGEPCTINGVACCEVCSYVEDVD